MAGKIAQILIFSLALGLSALPAPMSGGALAAEPLNPVDIKEWPISHGGRVRDPFARGPDEVWFVGQAGDYLGRFTPSTGQVIKRDLADEPGPHNLIVGRRGMVWYAGNGDGYIGRYDPGSDTIGKIAMPDPEVADPHTLVFDADETHIWFTVQWGNMIGRLTTASGKVDLIPVPTGNARPYGIKVAPNGTVWAVLAGTNKIASVNPRTLVLTEYNIPNSGARPRRVEITSDGRVWYADYARGFIGLFDPKTGSFGEWKLPSSGGARPYGMAADDQDRIWLVETGVSPNLFVGFDTRLEKIISITPIPSGAGSVRHMHYHAPTGTVWFGSDNNTLSRARVQIK